MSISRYSSQLGTIHIGLEAGPSSVQSTHEWSILLLPTLTSLVIPHESKDIVSSLMFLLQDEGVGFQADFRREPSGLLIRASLLPSDAPQSTWKRSENKKGDRATHLKRLFYHLERGWDSREDWLMARTVEDEQKMSNLYSAVPSPPEPDFSSRTEKTATDREIFSRLTYFEEPEGIKTRMYQYQFRSVAKMLRMETDPGRLVDLYFTEFTEAGREGTYYVNTATWDVQRHPGWYDLPRGGILCEQMGTGKTLMCLALIVATIHAPPAPPSNTLDISPVLSDHSLSSYPFSSYERARELTGHPESDTRRAMPSLVDLCASVLTKHDVSPRRSDFLPPNLTPLLDRKNYYYIYPVDDPCTREAKRRVQRKKMKKMYLANTTLVVVPQILTEQWKLEMEKHVVQGTLKVLEVGKEPIPPVEKLLDYDIILMDSMRFSAEEDMHRASLELPPSELSKARWKRIIFDEGHVAGDKTSNAMRLAIALSVERRWLVSGTPTKHLQQGGEAESEESSGPLRSNVSGSPVWSTRDLDDAKRLGVMIGGFLAAEPFRSEAAFQERVTKLLRGKAGPKFGSVRRLKYIMGATMVKHAPHVIDLEASLPPSTLSTEPLMFHPMQRITYNVLTALIASNVYTSNFEDPDYFLHPRNLKSFNMVIHNLHLACFWYSAQEMGVSGSLSRTKHHLETNKTLTEQGRKVLQEAVAHMERALETPGWDEWMVNGVSIPFEANESEFPEMVRQSWSDSMDTSPDVIDSHSLRLLRDLNVPGKTLQELNLAGWESRRGKHTDFMEELDKAEQRAIREERRMFNEDTEDMDLLADNSKADDVKAAAHAPVSAQKLTKKAKRSLYIPKAEKRDALDDALAEASSNAARVIRLDTPIRDAGPRPLPTVIHTKSRSSKINYVIQTIVDSAEVDKFVIFGDVFEHGHLIEALDIFNIKSTFVGPGVAASKKAEELKKFETPQVKVCLLDLKTGARGLNLVVANRMIFLSPVWSLDVQAQAIKRVHRIGQTKPTKVEILVTEGTFEEDIARRASGSRSEQEEQMYSRALIESPRFVHLEHEGDISFPVNFIPTDEMDSLKVEITPTASSPDTSPDTSPVTPLCAGIGSDRVRIVSPEPSILQNRAISPDDGKVSILKKPLLGELEPDSVNLRNKRALDENTRGGERKKRVRVAFA